MMTFRKLAADSAGKLIRAYFTENTPQPTHDFKTEPGKVLDSGGRLTSYYTGRDSRATWRPDMPVDVAKALGVDVRTMPKDTDLDRLFEAKRGDTGEAWTEHKRKVSAYDSGQVVTAASLQGWRTGQTIESVMDPRGEALIGTPAYYGAGQAMEAAGMVHLNRYCSTTDAAAGLCTAAATAMQNADQRASSLFGADNLTDQNGVNAANDFGTNLIQPIVPAALRGDQLTSINGQDAAARRREYNARMSLARSAIDVAIGQQTPGVTLTAQQQQLLTNEGLTPPASGSWLQALSLEATRRISDVSWAAGLQQMPPASVEREIATELALSNYLALQQYRISLLNTTISGTRLAATEEATYRPATQMPSPSMASN